MFEDFNKFRMMNRRIPPIGNTGSAPGRVFFYFYNKKYTLFIVNKNNGFLD